MPEGQSKGEEALSDPPQQPGVEELIEKRIDEERKARELQLVAQEHRLIPALSNLVSALLQRDPTHRRQLLGRALTALFWCLIPSGGTVSVGIVAVLSLFLAWQQTRLLSAQNEKIEIQNMLAEAQRRSGLMFENAAIFQIIEKEKTSTAATRANYCERSGRSDQCWVIRGGQLLFVPSRATTGRIAALTQALRPYKYLSVEDQGPYRFTSGEVAANLCPESISSDLLQYAVTVAHKASLGVDGKPNPDPADAKAFRAAMQAKAETLFPASLGWLTRAERAVHGVVRTASGYVVGTPRAADSAVSCRASSPERGQLLLSLYAAAIDITHLARSGADFRFADLPGANLQSIVLQGVDLSNARLPGASFAHATLERVNFSGAHLAGARFTDSVLRDVNLTGAIVQASGTQATNASLLLAAISRGSLNGIKIVEMGMQGPFFNRWCAAMKLMRNIQGEQPKLPGTLSLEQYALLTETRQYSDGSPPTLEAIIVPATHDVRQVLVSHHDFSQRISVSYDPFSACRL